MKTFYVGMKNQMLTIQETKTGSTYSRYLKGHKANRLALDPQNKDRQFLATDDGLWKQKMLGTTGKKQITG